MSRALAVLALVVAILPVQVSAHALDPGYLELRHLGGTDWGVTLRRPDVQGRPMAIDVALPEGCGPTHGPPPAHDGRAFVTSWVATCEDGLGGGTIRIPGLERTRTDVLVRYTLPGMEEAQTTRLTLSAPSFEVARAQGPWARAQSYVALGVDHILMGLDHLLFVFLLLLLIRRTRLLVGAITAFTVAHSLSLAAATLGWIAVPAAPVEAIIALSIVILATELVQPPGTGLQLTSRFPWAVSFSFGLLHGLGFASALRDIGVPQGDVPLALFAFNLGVEAGQLMFIAAVLTAGFFLGRVGPRPGPVLARGGPAFGATVYAIGGLAAYWMIDRIAGFVT